MKQNLVAVTLRLDFFNKKQIVHKENKIYKRSSKTLKYAIYRVREEQNCGAIRLGWLACQFVESVHFVLEST